MMSSVSQDDVSHSPAPKMLIVVLRCIASVVNVSLMLPAERMMIVLVESRV